MTWAHAKWICMLNDFPRELGHQIDSLLLDIYISLIIPALI